MTPNGASFFDIKRSAEMLGNEEKKALLAVHALSGCDSVSSLFGKGKKSAFEVVQKSLALQKALQVFLEPHALKMELFEAGRSFLLHLYGCGNSKTLEAARYKLYLKKVTTMGIKSDFDLSSLPPTTSAAQFHILRAYHTVQQWMGKKLPPTEFGWTKTGNCLVPVVMKAKFAPEFVLNMIKCACKKGCSGKCSCKKSGLLCSSLCMHCKGVNCCNCGTDTAIDDFE